MNEMVLNLREGRCPNPGNALIRAVRRLPPRSSALTIPVPRFSADPR